MKKPSDPREDWGAQREKIIGLGERSHRKTFYPELQQRLDELERFRALVDQSNDCIFLLHAPSLKFIDVNESACRQLGCDRHELLFRPLTRFLPEEAVTLVGELVAARSAQGSDRATITTTLRKCSGEGMPVEITIRLVAFNKELYGVAVARDITERRMAEKALLENSLIMRDMQLARQIQLSLLPPGPPDLPGVLLAGCCVPAAHVGGDYYDYYRRGHGKVDMVIADVSGHSIGAALMMVEARSALNAQVHSFIGTGDLLASLNEVLYDDLSQAEIFITMFYVKYDSKNRTLTYSNAGHSPPLLFRRGETGCWQLDAEGLILGIRKEVTFEEKQLQMEEGDLLFLHTDGITEACNSDGEMFGNERLCGILRGIHGEPPEAIIDAVLREIMAFTGATALEDDVTMVAMKVV
jgi:phosphoserine phosphatase RsbU/P